LESCWWSRASPAKDNDSGIYAAATAAIVYHDDNDFASIVLKRSKHDLSCGAERWEEEAEEQEKEEEEEEEVQQLYHALQAQSSQNSCL
jgi:hypothetical protein